MSEIPFHSTRMAQRFYEATMPALVRELGRLNDNLERMLATRAPEEKVEESTPADIEVREKKP